jgi:class 3 adenylate cyclase
MSDMVRSTQISVAAGDEVYLSLVDAHRAILRRRLRERGGVEVDTAGDGPSPGFAPPPTPSGVA